MMMTRWGTLVTLGVLLVIAGCTRDAGVQPFEPAQPSGDTTPLPPTPTTVSITVESQSVQTEAVVEPTDTDAPDDTPTEVPVDTDIPVLDVTDTPTTAPTNTARPSPTPRPSNTPAEAAEPTEDNAMVESMTEEDDAENAGVMGQAEEDEDTTPQAGFTPAVPGVFPSDTPMPTSTPLVTREPLVTPTQDGEPAVDAEGVPLGDGDGCTYTVRAGDNAFRIAVNNNITLTELREANPALAGENPLLQPGQELDIPGCGQGTRVNVPPTDDDVEEPLASATLSPDGFIEYTVQNGDTLLQIARVYDTTITDIVEANDLTDPNRLSVGQVLLIPEGSASAGDE